MVNNKRSGKRKYNKKKNSPQTKVASKRRNKRSGKKQKGGKGLQKNNLKGGAPSELERKLYISPFRGLLFDLLNTPNFDNLQENPSLSSKSVSIYQENKSISGHPYKKTLSPIYPHTPSTQQIISVYGGGKKIKKNLKGGNWSGSDRADTVIEQLNRIPFVKKDSIAFAINFLKLIYLN